MSESIDIARTSDLMPLASLFDAYRQFYGKPGDVDAARAFLADRMHSGESRIFVARQGDGIVGFTQLYPIFSSVSLRRAWLLNDLYVALDARGRGVAERLLKAAVDHGRESGAAWLMLQTGQDNDIAQRLYERCGWRRDDTFLSYTFLL